jgi:pimeloyl-ACP methyl ester carboxylesterase
MYIKIKNLNIHYKVAGAGAPLIMLHGWGCSAEYFTKLQQHLAKRFTVYTIDLPGFGLSSPPEEIWGTKEYAELMAKFIQAIHIDEPILLGHSFGGKVIIFLLTHELISGVKKIILVSSPGVKLPQSFEIKAKIIFFKIIKFFLKIPIIKKIFNARFEFYKNKFGSTDYKNASSLMRAILVKVVNEDLSSLLPLIKTPTLLLWGAKDTTTPLKSAEIMQNKIFGSKLIVFPDSGHHPFLDNYHEIMLELDEFLK